MHPCRAYAAAVLAAAAMGCSSMAADPSPVEVGQRFEMSPGSTVAVEAAGLVIRFDRVVADSRCPADAICITAGDAELAFSLGRDGLPPRPVSLYAESPGNRLASGEWVLVLTTLQPFPLSSRPIDPAAYRATLFVDRNAEPAR